MTIDDFNQTIDAQLKICHNLLINKGNEYSFNSDRLKAFKTGAALQNITQKQCLLGMLTKHIISIYDMVSTNKHFNINKWTEKISDAINYLLILKSMLVEEEYEKNKC